MSNTNNNRRATITRETGETKVAVQIDFDGTGDYEIDTKIPFLDHMLAQIARHGRIDLKVTATGDLEVDTHHTVEDTGIVLGQAFREALGDVTGIVRYGQATIPLDEALTRVVVDLSGRSGLFWEVNFTQEAIGGLHLDMLQEMMIAFVNQAKITLHIDNLKGRNAHHQAETIFKGLGRAFNQALQYDARIAGITPSTKDTL